jgi:outer membrane protein
MIVEAMAATHYSVELMLSRCRKHTSVSHFSWLFVSCLLTMGVSLLRANCQELRALATAPLSLEETQKYALTQNREIKEATYEVTKKEAAIRVIIAQRYPKLLGFVFGGQQLNRDPGNYPFNFAALPAVLEPVTQQYRLGLQVRQATTEMESARERLRLTKQRVIAEVKRVYLNAVALKSAITSREQNIEFLKELNRYVNAQVKHGASLPVDALQSEAQVAQADYELDKDRDDLISLGQMLNRLLGREVLSHVEFAETANLTLTNPDKQKAIDEAVFQRPELRQINLSVRSSKLNEKIELSHYIPDISIGTIGAFSHALQPTLPKELVAVGFLASWEPWDWGRKIQLGKISERTMRQSQVELSDKRDSVIVEVDNVRRSLAVVAKQVHAANLKVSSTNEELRVLTKRYQFGSSLFKDVVETQSAYSKAITDKVAADTNYASLQVELDRVLGRDFN